MTDQTDNAKIGDENLITEICSFVSLSWILVLACCLWSRNVFFLNLIKKHKLCGARRKKFTNLITIDLFSEKPRHVRT